MNQDDPVLMIVICVVAFIGGYAVISKLIDWYRSRTSAGPRGGPDRPVSSAPRMRMGLEPAASSTPTAPASARGVPAFEGVLAVCSLVAEAPGSFTFSELGLVKQFLEALGQAQNVPPSHARRIAVEAQTKGCDLEVDNGIPDMPPDRQGQMGRAAARSQGHRGCAPAMFPGDLFQWANGQEGIL